MYSLARVAGGVLIPDPTCTASSLIVTWSPSQASERPKILPHSAN